ncbi:MAG: phytanoyl-CoA dioxygenase family protein [Caulobacteraceae bacterium]
MDARTPPTAAEADYLLRTKGWVLFPNQLPEAQVAALSADSDRVYDICRPVQETNGVAANMEGAAHHVAGYGGALDDFLEDFPLHAEIERYFDGKYIVLNYGAALNPPGTRSYTFKPHRDIRHFSPGFRLSLNMLVLLSPFNPTTGGTLMLSGSHHVEDMPPTAFFEAHAEGVVGEPGDIVLFDSLLVHSAAPNLSNDRRRALTICLGRPFMKPQMDWPRYLTPEVQARLTPAMKQLLGFNARVASSLDEYYQPEERWTFRADQR